MSRVADVGAALHAGPGPSSADSTPFADPSSPTTCSTKEEVGAQSGQGATGQV